MIRLLLIAAVVSLGILSACDDHSTPPPLPEWNEIGPKSEIFGALMLSDGSLITAAGRNGVFSQGPAFVGTQNSLGLVLTDPMYIGTPYGSRSLLVANGELFVGVHVPPDTSLRLVYRRGIGLGTSETWKVSDTGMELRDVVYDFVNLGGERFLAATSRALYESTDGGSSWAVAYAWGPVHTAVFCKCSDNSWIGGQFGNREPVLWRILDDGLRWYYLSDIIQGVEGERVTSISSSGPESKLMISVGSSVYSSSDDARTFHLVLKTGSEVTIHVNPANPREQLALSDSLYVSVDSGATWRGSEIPGEITGVGVVDWEHNLLALPILGSDGGTVVTRSISDLLE